MLPGVHVPAQSDCTSTPQMPLLQQGPGQILGEHEPNRCQVPPLPMHTVEELIEQFPFTQHEPLHGLGAHDVPPRYVPEH